MLCCRSIKPACDETEVMMLPSFHRLLSSSSLLLLLLLLLLGEREEQSIYLTLTLHRKVRKPEFK